MNPNSTRTQPLGIEVEFHPSEIALVAHIPAPSGGTLYWLIAGGRLINEDGWKPVDRAVLRAVLLESLRRLDETEPASTIRAGR